MVRARSAALMPVVIPRAASTLTWKSVLNVSRFCVTIRSTPNCCSRSAVVGTQIRPRPCLAMKLIASGVACSAAMIRSPSFSRSASSTTMTSLPLRRSSITASIESIAVFIAWSEFSRRPADGQQQISRGIDCESGLPNTRASGFRCGQRRFIVLVLVVVIEEEDEDDDDYDLLAVLAAQRDIRLGGRQGLARSIPPAGVPASGSTVRAAETTAAGLKTISTAIA